MSQLEVPPNIVARVRSFNGSKFLANFAYIIVIIAGLDAGQSVLVPFMFGIFFALIASGPIYILVKNKVPTWLAITSVTSLIIALFIIVLTFIVGSIEQFTQMMPKYSQNFEAYIAQVNLRLADWRLNLSQFTEVIKISDYLGIITKTLKSTVQTVSSFVLIIIIMVFIILEAASFRTKIDSALGDNVDLEKFDGVALDVQRYLLIKTFMCLITGILVGILVSVAGLDFALLWAFIALILNYIPFIGSIIAAIPAVMLALVQYNPTVAIVVGLGYLAINMIISNVLEPVFMGKRLGLSVLIVFLSLLFWGWLWGPAGALMSVPLTMIVKIFLEHSPELSWVAKLMASPKALKSHSLKVRAD